MITFERLRYFIEAATCEHVGRAAKNASISPSVISSAIKVLEEELGCELFTRESNRVKLNDNGRLLLERAHSLLEGRDAIYSIASTTPELKGHYRVAASPFLLEEYLVPAFLKLQKGHPQLTADFLSVDTGQAIVSVASRSVDLALVFRSIQTHVLEEKILHEGQFHIAVRKKHPILKERKLSLLNKLPAITFRPSAGFNYVELHPMFKKNKLMPEHKLFYNNNRTAIKLIAQTDGWALLPDLVINKYKADVTKIEAQKSWDAPYTIALVKNESSSSYIFNAISRQLGEQFSMGTKS